MAATTSCRLRQEQYSRAHQPPERSCRDGACSCDWRTRWKRPREAIYSISGAACWPNRRHTASRQPQAGATRSCGMRGPRINGNAATKRSAVLLSGSSTPPPLGAPVGSGWKCRCMRVALHGLPSPPYAICKLYNPVALDPVLIRRLRRWHIDDRQRWTSTPCYSRNLSSVIGRSRTRFPVAW
jgi:hypothetical protein